MLHVLNGFDVRPDRACLVTAGFTFLVLTQSALAESWRAFGVSSPNVLFSVDEASLKRDANKVTFVERLVFVVPEQRDQASNRWVKEKRVLRVMDCTAKTQGHLQGSLLGEDGRLIEAQTVVPQEMNMTPIPPNSVAAEELQWACAGKQP
jgi:hypothetical protein